MELKGRSQGLKMDLMAESDHQQVICYFRRNRVPKCLVARRSTQQIEGLESVEEVREGDTVLRENGGTLRYRHTGLRASCSLSRGVFLRRAGL